MRASRKRRGKKENILNADEKVFGGKPEKQMDFQNIPMFIPMTGRVLLK